MAVIPVGYGQANFIFSGAAYPTGAQVVLGFNHSETAFSASESAEAIGLAWEGNIMAKMVNDITLDTVRVKYGPNDLGAEGEYASGVAGLGTGDDDSPNIALLVKKITSEGGRANKGRMYLPGLNESMVDTGGVIDSSELPLWQGVFDSFHADLIAVELFPVVLHGEDSPVATPTPIDNFLVDTRAATQRRRMRR